MCLEVSRACGSSYNQYEWAWDAKGNKIYLWMANLPFEENFSRGSQCSFLHEAGGKTSFIVGGSRCSRILLGRRFGDVGCELMRPCNSLKWFGARQFIISSQVLGRCWQMLVVPERSVKWQIFYSWVSFPGHDQSVGSSPKWFIQSWFQACGICPVTQTLRPSLKLQTNFLLLGDTLQKWEQSHSFFFGVCFLFL